MTIRMTKDERTQIALLKQSVEHLVEKLDVVSDNQIKFVIKYDEDKRYESDKREAWRNTLSKNLTEHIKECDARFRITELFQVKISTGASNAIIGLTLLCTFLGALAYFK